MSGWRLVELADCAEIVSGATPKTGVAEYWDGDVFWATPKDLSGLRGVFIGDTQRKITLTGLRSCASTVLPAGSVLLSSRAPIGHVAINTVPMATNQGFKSLVPRPGKVEAEYLYYWLRANRSFLEGLGNGATFKEISKATVSAVQIPLPPMEEQRRIAKVLDRADGLRAKRREALVQADNLAEAVFVGMFGDPVRNERGWSRVSAGSLLEKIHSGRSPNCHDRPARDGEWGVLKLGAVTSCEYLPGANKALPSGEPIRAEDEVRAGDLLFSRKNTRELVAACALVRSTPPRMLMPDLIFRLDVARDAPIEKVFLHRLLTHPSKRRAIQSLAGGSAGSMPNISKAKLLEVELELPPLPLQKAFSDRIESVEKLKAPYRASLVEMDALFASVQDRAFRGEL